MEGTKKLGWYSGKYDSTKQSVVMTDTYTEYSLAKYITSIRLEMLIGESIVITDAQWYDGLFFSTLATGKPVEFNEFIKFVSRGYDNGLPPFFVRRRPEYVKRMFINREFLFSSINNVELQAFIYNIWKGKNRSTDDFNDLVTYLDFIESELILNNKNHLHKYFLNFKSSIKALDSVDERIFVLWGKKAYIPEIMSRNKEKLCKMLDDKFVAFYDQKTIIELINTIKTELNKDFPNRSKVFGTLEELCVKTRQFSYRDKFMHSFDNPYNLAIALQHECKYYDLHDATQINENVQKLTGVIDCEMIPEKIIEHLGGLSWKEFGDIFYDDEVVRMRKEWLEAFDAKDVALAKKRFLNYLDCIMNKIHDLKIWFIDNSVFYRKSGTKRFIIKTVSDKMVGGASSEEQTDSDEICLFFGDINEISRDKMIRYASTDDTTKIFDTVFASIENAVK